MRGAIVGFGDIARYGHWPAYQQNPDLEIVAVVDPAPERRAVASNLSSSLAAFASVEQLADAFSGGTSGANRLDFIDICTPPAMHAEPMLAAIARGWHVLCEKPFLLDPLVVEDIRRRAGRAGVAVFPVHNWKYAPIVQRATEILRSGAIGPLRTSQVVTTRLRAAAIANPHVFNWRRDPILAGGGILMDHGWHAMYLTLHWFGPGAVGVRAILQRPRPDVVEDEASVEIVFPEGTGTIELTWNGTERSNRMRLVGESGEILIADDRLLVTGSHSAETVFERALSAGSHHDDWFAAMLPEVAACFRTPALSEQHLAEAAECLSIIRQAYQASASEALTTESRT